MLSGAIAAALAVATGAWVGWRLLLHGLRNVRIALRFGYRVATMTLYRRCPDCRRFIRSDARVCLHCGYRRAPHTHDHAAAAA